MNSAPKSTILKLVDMLGRHADEQTIAGEQDMGVLTEDFAERWHNLADETAKLAIDIAREYGV